MIWVRTMKSKDVKKPCLNPDQDVVQPVHQIILILERKLRPNYTRVPESIVRKKKKKFRKIDLWDTA